MKINCSSVLDGTMKHGASGKEIATNRRQFLETIGCDPSQACMVQLSYDSDDFCRYGEVDLANGGEGITRDSPQIADGLLTHTLTQALFLPLADCIGAVLWNEKETALMLTHLGRHNLEQQGAAKSVEYFCATTDTAPGDVRVYLSAAADGQKYPLYRFENRSLRDVTLEQLERVGIKRESIKLDPRDTTTDETLYSHSEFLKGARPSDGRFMIVACLAD